VPVKRPVGKERDMTETAHETKQRPPVVATADDAGAVSSVDLGAVAPRASQRNGSEPARAVPHDDLERDLDRISLQRALIDFDVANARVIDLTHRYVDATEEIKRLRHDLEKLRIEHGTTLADLDRTRSTKAYKIAERIWALRRALNV